MLVAPAEPLLAALVLALAVDALLGEPARLYRRVPHPVAVLGSLITALERRLWQEGQPQPRRRDAGRVLVVLLLAVATAVGLAATWLLHQGLAGWVATGLLASALLAQRSLTDHVLAVARGLETDLHKGRAAVALIVGRDPEALDAPGVARAAIESAAENASDGVYAPVVWWLLLGPIGLVGYKTVNTLDSMVGYRSERYQDFGRAAALLDDRVNWLPARLTAALILAAAPGRVRWSDIVANAPKHRSPNAGWPEAAMALALDARLAGPRVYAHGTVDDAWIGHGRSDLDAADIRRAVTLLWRVWALATSLAALALLVVIA